MRVLNEAVNADEWVVIEGMQKLRPGMRVKPERIRLDGQGGL
jgi:multidrug efflux system membrane fusion protein